MAHQPPVPPIDTSAEIRLNSALAQTFRPPATPTDLHSQVLAAVAAESGADAAYRRQQLDEDRRHAIAELNARYLGRCRDALIVGLGLVAMLGFAVRPLARWLTPLVEGAAPFAAGLLALGMGFAAGAIVWRDLFVQVDGAQPRG